MYFRISGEQLKKSATPYFLYLIIKNLNPEDLTVRWNNKTLQLVSGKEHVITDVVVRETKPSDAKFRFYGESFNDIITFDGKHLITVSYHRSVKKTEIVLDNCKLFTASVLFFHTLLDDFLN